MVASKRRRASEREREEVRERGRGIETGTEIRARPRDGVGCDREEAAVAIGTWILYIPLFF